MTKTNRVWQVDEPGKVKRLKQSITEPGPGELLVKIVSSAICGSDLHIFKGKHPGAPLPVTIGHEFSGTVDVAGKGVENFAPGDRVTVEPVLVCGKCEACRHGNYSYCENISFTYREGAGAMADYITVRADRTFLLPEHLSFDTGALIEPLSVALHAVRRGEIKIGEKVLIIGAGAIGILIASLCRKLGASGVFVADLSEKRLELAATMGATELVNSNSQDLEKTIDQLTSGKGVDKSFECVGLEKTFNQAIGALRKNGLATILGIFEEPNITISASQFVSKEIRVQGSQGYCWDFPDALEISRDLNLEALVSHRFPMGELQKALETGMDRNSGALKVLLYAEKGD